MSKYSPAAILYDSASHALKVIESGSDYLLDIAAKIAENPSAGLERLKVDASGAVKSGLYDAAGNALKIVTNNGDKVLQSAAMTAICTSEEGLHYLTVLDETGSLKATLYDENGIPVGNTFEAAKTQARAFVYLRSIGTPAELTTGEAEPFAVGGTTLTCTVNGSGDTVGFAARAATAGKFISGYGAPTANGETSEMKVSIDGGNEVEIAIEKNLTGGDTIAAAIQVEIRANVENGTGVVVEWEPTNYPNRYVVTSGTTGTASVVFCKDSGDHMGRLLKLDLNEGAYQILGQAADTYSAEEVASIIAAELPATRAHGRENGTVDWHTANTGSSATLQVTAGGANVALGFPTSESTGVDGTGSMEMAVNGAAGVKHFGLEPDDQYRLWIDRVVFKIVCVDAKLKDFGTVDRLTNGVLIKTTGAQNIETDVAAIKSNSDLFSFCNDAEIMIDARADGVDYVVGRWNLQTPFVLRPGTDDRLSVEIQDDLTGLVEFTAFAEGWYEVIE